MSASVVLPTLSAGLQQRLLSCFRASDEEHEGGLDITADVSTATLQLLIAPKPSSDERGAALRDQLDLLLRGIERVLVKKLHAEAAVDASLAFLLERCQLEMADRPRRELQKMVMEPAKPGDADYDPDDLSDDDESQVAEGVAKRRFTGILRRRYFYGTTETRISRVPGFRPAARKKRSAADAASSSDPAEQPPPDTDENTNEQPDQPDQPDCESLIGDLGTIEDLESFESLECLPHQANAAIKLLNQGGLNTDAFRKALGANWHSTGAGKTVTAALIIATRHMMMNRSVEDHKDETGLCLDKKFLLVCPKAVLLQHLREYLKWLKVPTSRYLVADNHCDITAKRLDAAKIILVTYPCAVSCLKHSWWVNPAHRFLTERGTNGGPPLQRPIRGKERALTPQPDHVRQRPWLANAMHLPPPDHPLYEASFLRKINLVCLDESQEIGKASTWANLAVRMLTDNAVEVAAFSGTPVKNDVAENAAFNKACSTLPEHFRTLKAWRPTRSTVLDNEVLKERRQKSICRATNDAFHLAFVTLATNEQLAHLMPVVARVSIEFDPFVGLLPDGTVTDTVIKRYNGHVQRVRELATQAQNAYKFESVHTSGTGGYTDVMAAVTFTEQAVFNPHLAMKKGGINRSMTEDLSLALEAPSQYMILLHRLVRDRQRHGRCRIILYCMHTSYLFILEAYFRTFTDSADDSVGGIFRIEGSLSSKARDMHRRNFLHSAKGVLLISSSGATGLNLVPGCETVISFGAMPWSPSEIQQAEGRVNRIKVQKNPVEILRVMSKGGTFKAKQDTMHKDKGDRLIKACVNKDYSRFSKGINSEAACWAESHAIARSVELLDDTGNVLREESLRAANHTWRLDADEAASLGFPAPPPPPTLDTEPPPVLAKDFALPPTSFPVDGFDEAVYLAAEKVKLEQLEQLRAEELKQKKAAARLSKRPATAIAKKSSAKKKAKTWLASSDDSSCVYSDDGLSDADFKSSAAVIVAPRARTVCRAAALRARLARALTEEASSDEEDETPHKF